MEADCHDRGVETLVATADVGEQADVDRAFDAAVDRFGRVDAVVNSAAAVGYGRFEDVPAEVFDRVIVTNLLGTANVARTALRQFRRQSGGHLVLMGSLLGKIAVPFMSPYVTSKWGVHGLARILQIEARQTPGIEVSVVSPGSVNTPAYLQAANYAGWEGRPPPPIDPPEKVARAVVRCLEPAPKGPRGRHRQSGRCARLPAAARRFRCAGHTADAAGRAVQAPADSAQRQRPGAAAGRGRSVRAVGPARPARGRSGTRGSGQCRTGNGVHRLTRCAIRAGCAPVQGVVTRAGFASSANRCRRGPAASPP